MYYLPSTTGRRQSINYGRWITTARLVHLTAPAGAMMSSWDSTNFFLKRRRKSYVPANLGQPSRSFARSKSLAMGISGRTFPISKTLDRGPILYNINIVYNLEIVRSAQKDIKRLDRPVRIRVIDAIELLVADPYRQGARQLDSGIFRYRVGHYRIIYNVDNDTVTVRIVRVRHRSEVYREKK